MEYSKKNPQQVTFQFVGIWNIPEKNINSENLENYGIWNTPGIFQKNSKTIEITKILEYGIFLEYSKKTITTLGGVKFNQVRKPMGLKGFF